MSSKDFEIKFSKISSSEELEPILEEAVLQYYDEEDIIAKIELLLIIERISATLRNSLDPSVDEYGDAK